MAKQNYKKIVRTNLEAISKTNKTLKDIYSVIFSHDKQIAYELLVDMQMQEVSYSTLDKEVRAFAAYLKTTFNNITGQFVAIDLATSPNFLVAFWGTLMAGAKPYLVNSYYPADVRVRLLKRLEASVVISSTSDYSEFKVVDITTFNKDCPAISDEFWANEFALSSTLTGLEAKMCVFEGEAVVNQITNARDILKKNNWLMNDYEKRIKVAMILPLFHIFGIMVSYFWFAFFGQTMVFLKDNAPDTVRATINRHKVTHIFAPPILYHKLYKGIALAVSQESEKRRKKFNLGVKLSSSLQNSSPRLGVKIARKLFKEVLSKAFGPSPQFMISGGAYIDRDALKIINAIGYPLFNGYGTTETAITGANLAKKFKTRINGSVGAPFSSVKYTFEDDGGLVVSGNSLCSKIISFTDEQSDFACITTNDLVKIEKGQYYIIGRKKDLFIGESGENISPDTIQYEIRTKSASRVCVIDLNGKLSIVLEYGEKLPNSVILKEIADIKTQLPNIAYGQFINDIFVTRDLIANPNAIKPSRALLKRKVDEKEVTLINYKDIKDDRLQAKEAGVDDSTMTSIKQAFKNATDATDEITSTTDFFIDLNGTSIDYMTLISELDSIFSISINLEKNRNLRTPENFYEYIGGML